MESGHLFSFNFLGAEPIRAMPTSRLTTISASFVIRFGKDHKAFLPIKIFWTQGLGFVFFFGLFHNKRPYPD